MDICQNIILPIFKGEQPVPTYYLSHANSFGLFIHDTSNNVSSVYAWTEFEVKKRMNNIASFLLCWLNYKGSSSKSYGKNHKMPEIDILIDSCGGQNMNNAMIQFINMIN